MSDYDSYEVEYSDQSAVEFSDDNSIEINDVQEDMHYKIMYTFPTSKTSTGKPTHRMKFQTLNVEDIQKKLHGIVENLANILHLDYGVCMALLCEYEWKEDKLMDDYMNTSNPDQFFKSFGLQRLQQIKKSTLIITETNPDILCEICCCGPEPGQPMAFFSLSSCEHKFCTDCYIQYVETKNKDSITKIECPFSDPKCKQRLLLSELSVLSDYKNNHDTKPIPKQQRISQFITEDEIKKMYHLSDDDSDTCTDNGEYNSDSDEIILTKKVYDYQQEISRREREEKETKHNISLLSKYWYNLATHYCYTQVRKYKHCPYPDCDSVVELLGFDSDTVASLEEHMDLMLVPMVRCGNQHKFCFGCNEATHSPCPCIAVKKWIKKCEDDSETLNWIESHTKECPKCFSLIEKNGGCNHMTCRKCLWQFCWICLGDWVKHVDNYRCDLYTATDKNPSLVNARVNLERYMFYFKVFNNQRLSYEKDRDSLSKFEIKIKELEPAMGASWIETNFYKECIKSILECRLTLKWSYAFLYFVPSCQGKSLIETAQWQLSNKVEELSKLFQDVEISDVIKRKSSFIKVKSAMLVAQDKFVETCVDIFADSNTLKHIKTRI